MNKHTALRTMVATALLCAQPLAAQIIQPPDADTLRLRPQIPEPPAVNFDYDVDTLCRPGQSHALAARWNLTGAASPVATTLTVLMPNGDTQKKRSLRTTGTEIFEVDAPFGANATMVLDAEDANGAPLYSILTANLPACESGPVADDFDSLPPPPFDPPITGTPESDPNEVDVLHVSGSPNGPVPTRIVAAAGTGSGARLYSYHIDPALQVSQLFESDSFAGLDVKLEKLEGGEEFTVESPGFISGHRREGDLWLRSWNLLPDGKFLELSTRGYGSNANVEVQAYAIATRVLPNGNYQIVTPIRTQWDTLRTITWEVDDASGNVVGRMDSGDWGNPGPSTELTIANLNDDLYVVSYRNDNSDLTQQYWSVSNGGDPSLSGGAVSGLNLRGDGAVVREVQDVLDLPITTDDFITPLIDSNGDLMVHTWETRQTGFDEGTIIYTPFEISDNSRDEDPNGYGIDILPEPNLASSATDAIRALLTDGMVEDFYGVGQGELYREFPLFEPISVHIASVTKNMTLLIAVDAIESGTASLNDQIVINAEEASIGGSQMGLIEGETQTLETLLYGMMLRSGNDASAAIARHLGGTYANFEALMGLWASNLNLNDTFYGPTSPTSGAAAGGGVSTPQDQVTLWMEAIQHPLFVEIASAKTFDDCGIAPGGGVKCWFITKLGDSGYVGLEGWKGGNGGMWVNGYSDDGGRFCTGNGCLVAQATRMDRPMIVGLQQTGNRWNAADDLFDYGFRMQFTPDHRGDEESGGLIDDFALDAVTDGIGITVDIDGFNQELKVCSWNLFADGGQIDQRECDSREVKGLAGGTHRAVRNRVDGAFLSSLSADGDYWTGHAEGGNLMRLNLWRVGRKD
ncbi:MAG: serine hydrolase [Pseudomonadota bacterium]